MKPLRIVLAPTSNRPLNIFLGLVLVLVALLVLLALASYHATDSSWNTASGATGPEAVRNWIGIFGASLSDLLLQSLGVTAFFIPLWLCGLGWTWMRSRPGGLAWLRWVGALLALAFTPAVLALLPGAERGGRMCLGQQGLDQPGQVHAGNGSYCSSFAVWPNRMGRLCPPADRDATGSARTFL